MQIRAVVQKFHHGDFEKVLISNLALLNNYITARQNGFIYKVKTQANDYQNLKVDTLRVQNNRKLKSYTVEFFSGKFLSVITGIRTHDPQI